MSSTEIGRPSTNLATSQPSSGTKATTSGPIPRSKARLPAACSTARSIPRSEVLAPPIRSTKTSPPTETLKFLLVIPPPSSSTTASRPGHSRSTAAKAPSTSPGSYLLRPHESELRLNSWVPLRWPRERQVDRDRFRRAAREVRAARHHQRPPHHGRQGDGLGAVGRERQALRRLRRRHRRDERRPRAPARHEGGAGTARERDAHLFPGRALRVLPPPGGAPVRGRSDQGRVQGHLLLLGSGGDRERRQDRACRRSSSSRCSAKAASSPRRSISCAACATSATSTGSCS